MASTITLARTLALTQQFIYNAPLTFPTIAIPTSDPGFSNADWVRQFLLSPPFAWRWNRTTTQIVTQAGQQDYVVALANFGWIEKATVYAPTQQGGRIHELEVAMILGNETNNNLPTKIAVQLDDDAGNITFRLFPAPDKNYTLTIYSQNAPVLFVATTDLWSPIPDYLSYLYNQGMLAKAFEFKGDSRFSEAMPLFLHQVLAANAGFLDTQKSLFMYEQLEKSRTAQSSSISTQAGWAGKNGQ